MCPKNQNQAQLSKFCQTYGIIVDICIIGLFTAFSLLLLHGLVTDDYITWDLSIPHFDPSEYVKWTFRPSSEISAGGTYLFSSYPTFLEAFLTFITNNITAAKIMTISPIPISFATLYYSARKLSFGRLSCAGGAFFYAICPTSFALLFSPGQQIFYALLPLIVMFTLLNVNVILRSNKFQIYSLLILSVLYAVSLSFMPQGILLLIPVVLIIVLYLIIKYPENLKHKFKRLLLNGSLICIVSFLLLLPFSVSFLLPYFNFLSSGKFVNDPFQPTRNVLYQDTKIYNTIRLAGIGDYHIEELGYNDLTNPINILGLILCSSIVIAPLVILYKDKYRRELLQFTTQSPHRFNFLLIVLIILLAGVLIIELGRNGALWQLPLSSLLRNPIKPMMLISVSLAFLTSYLLMFINSFVKTKRNLVVSLVLILLICISSVYTSRYFDGTGWLGPVTEYWASQGVAVEPSDFVVTTSMKDTLEFAKTAEKVDLQPYRFFVFPLMPSQTQFFRYNLPLISGDLIGSIDSEKLYAEYIHKVNDLILSGDNRTAISLSALRGKYIAVINDLKSAGYKGIPYKWGGLRGALAGDPQIFEQIISKIESMERSPEKNNIFVNTYNPLPLLSYVENAILVEGNLNDLFNFYNYVTPKNGSTIIPIFADQISQKGISSLLSSKIVKTTLHNSTNSVNSVESDLFIIPSQSIGSKIHYDNNFTFSNLDAQVLVQDAAKNIDLTLMNSTLRMATGLPIGGNDIASFSYINDNMINLTRFDTLFLKLNSSVPNLEYIISIFDDAGRQIIFKLKDDGRGSNREYELKIADGTILDTDGITPIQTMSFEKIRKLQIGFAGYDPSILEHSTNSVELSVGSAYFANIGDKITEFYVSDLPLKKPFNALWIRHTGDPYLSRINTNDRNISGYEVSEPEIGMSLFEFPPRAINQSTKISVPGHNLTTPIILSSSIHPIKNLSDEVLSSLKYPNILQNDATSYNVAFPGQENKLLIFSLLFDRQWLSSSGISVPVHGFLNGYLLDEGQQSIYLKNHLLRDVIYRLFEALISVWVAIGVIMIIKIRHTIKRILSKTLARTR